MTHLFEVSLHVMTQLVNKTKQFDILQFRRGVSVGDTIIYQLEDLYTEEDEKAYPSDESIPHELQAEVINIFHDTERALRKGFVGVGFEHSNGKQ